jgi:hypothetical protein
MVWLVFGVGVHGLESADAERKKGAVSREWGQADTRDTNETSLRPGERDAQSWRRLAF